MASITFYGHVPMTYSDWIDTATGKTLVCQPGGTYNVVPASGNIRSVGLSMPTDGRFTVSSGREVKKKEIPATPDTDELPSKAEEGAV